MRYYRSFPNAIPLLKAGCSCITHPSATARGTEAPLAVRLACVKRAASVRPEPGSNSLFVCIKIIPLRSVLTYPVLALAWRFPFFIVRFASDFL